MEGSYQLNITRIKAVANALEPLKQKVVFIGGAAIALYTNPQTSMEVRPTDDVDVVLELATYGGYAKLEERLREIGFVNDTESNVICRFKIKGITVDIMPTDSNVIGFTNRWYKEGFDHAVLFELNDKNKIYIFPLPYLIAAKLEAFLSRGKGDFIYSRDFEDIVYLLENADGIEETLLNSESHVRNYFAQIFSTLIYNTEFEEGLYAHLDPAHSTYQVERIKIILKKLVDGF